MGSILGIRWPFLLPAICIAMSAIGTAGDPPSGEFPNRVACEIDVPKGGDIIVLPVVIGGERYSFALGTGSLRSEVDARLRPALIERARRAGRPDFELKNDEAPALPIAVGTESFTPAQPMRCSDLTGLREHCGYDIDGIAGLDFFRDRIVQIDFDHGKFRILSSFSDANLPLNSSSKPLTADPFGSGLRTLRLDLSGEPHFFVVDTLFPRTLAMHPIFFRRLTETGTLTPFLETSFYVMPRSRFCMREALLDSASCDEVTHRGLSLLEQERNRVGLAYLSRYQLTFDFQQNWLYLVPGARCYAPDLFARTGIELVRKDRKVTVLYVFPDQPAFRAGVAVGDVIAAIDGENASSFSMFEIRKALSEKDRVLLTVTRTGKTGTPSDEITVQIENALLPQLRQKKIGDGSPKTDRKFPKN
jgi:hypothetical protein